MWLLFHRGEVNASSVITLLPSCTDAAVTHKVGFTLFSSVSLDARHHLSSVSYHQIVSLAVDSVISAFYYPWMSASFLLVTAVCAALIGL